jgi:hypothetical protein
VSGFTVTITEHIPPPPIGLSSIYPDIEPPYDTSDEHLKTLTQTELVVTCPLLEASLDNDEDGAAPKMKTPEKATLKADRPIIVEDWRGPQLILCTITPQDEHSNPSKPFQALAKIFDPLYYSFQNPNAPRRPVATPLEADSDYSIEAAAYAYLQKTNQTGRGGFVPEYYGSWTFSLPIRLRGVQHHRHVRLLLVEYIDGVCMRDPCYGDAAPLAWQFAAEHRLDVFAGILDGAVRMDHSGVNQHDLLPRNIMLEVEDAGEGESLQRVVKRAVLVDYNIALVYHLAPEAQRYRDVTELPMNPMQMFWSVSLDDFGYWVPEDWQGNEKPRREWLMERFGGANALAYAPVSRELTMDDY